MEVRAISTAEAARMIGAFASCAIHVLADLLVFASGRCRGGSMRASPHCDVYALRVATTAVRTYL